MTLKELTGSDLGIVIENDYTAVICRFDDLGEDELPDMINGELSSCRRNGIFNGAEESYDEQLKVYLVNMDPLVLYDEQGIYRQLFTNRQPQPGKIYTLNDGTQVCVPDSWYEFSY